MTINPDWMIRLNPYQKFTGREYQPYALAIGQACIAWNYFQEELGTAFDILTQNGNFSGSAVWYATNFDRPRRELLKAVISSAFDRTAATNRQKLLDEMRNELLWVLAEAEKLENLRNNVIHSPIRLFDETDEKFGLSTGVSADTTKGNPRAKNMRKTEEGLQQIRWLRDTSTVLGRYVHGMYWKILLDDSTLPGRPKLPNRGNKSARQRRKGQSSA